MTRSFFLAPQKGLVGGDRSRSLDRSSLPSPIRYFARNDASDPPPRPTACEDRVGAGGHKYATFSPDDLKEITPRYNNSRDSSERHEVEPASSGRPD
jgi:hypothetical protein